MTATSHPPICFGLQGRVVIVTGAAQGIGEACARRFAQEGAQVVLVDRDAQAGAALAQALGTAAEFVQGDVIHRATADAAVTRTVERFGRIDILLNNAGITHASSFLDLAEEDFDRVLDVNLKSYFLFGQAAARAMVEQGGDVRPGDGVWVELPDAPWRGLEPV